MNREKNLLAIPNDATNAYLRNPMEDFLSEFNPLNFEKKRFFQEVYFLNWKDYQDEELFGIKSINILSEKEKPLRLVKDLGKHKLDFVYPLFTDFFKTEINQITNRAREAKASIIRAFNADHAAELGILMKEKLGLPLVVSVHNMPRVTGSINYADSIVCISECLIDKCVQEYDANPNKISLIPDGVDMNLFYNRSKEGIYNVVDSKFNNKYKLLSVGRIIPQKNLEKVLEAVSIINEKLGNVTHIHLGLGDEESTKKIFEFRDSLGLENVSYFLGGKQKEHLPFYYSWADVNLFPSIYEGLGRASIESLACEVPVVTTNYAPMNEVVKEGFNGMLSNPNDSQEIASKTIEVLTKKSFNAKLKFNSRKSVVEKYGVDIVMKKHCENYANLIK